MNRQYIDKYYTQITKKDPHKKHCHGTISTIFTGEFCYELNSLYSAAIAVKACVLVIGWQSLIYAHLRVHCAFIHAHIRVH